MNPDEQNPQQIQTTTVEPIATATSTRSKTFPLVLVIAGGLLFAFIVLGVGLLAWQSFQPLYTASGQRLIKVHMDNGSLTPNEIDAPYNQQISIAFTATNQAPEEVTIPGYLAQTTVAQYSATNIEFTASMKGTFPIFRIDNGAQHQIGKVVVR